MSKPKIVAERAISGMRTPKSINTGRQANLYKSLMGIRSRNRRRLINRSLITEFRYKYWVIS
jgi:hypothetical protein